MVKITINNHDYQVEEGLPLLQVALDLGIEIPHFCFDEDLDIEANCRACLVEIVKSGEIVTSCSLKTTEGLAVITESDELMKLRKENLELLLADHLKRCPSCLRGLACPVEKIIKSYTLEGKYHRDTKDWSIHQMAQAAEIDPNLCIACDKCVKVCRDLGIGFLELKGKGKENRIGITDNQAIDCIYCGQCTVHCPVGAAREQNQIEEVEAALRDEANVVIAQMAPAVRVSIGELFGDKPGVNYEKKMYTAFRQLGFNQVFDVNMGADVTTMVEAQELVERIEEGGVLPMFTSCCPGWVKMVEYYYPELIPNLTTSRSPQIHAGAAYKTWWAERMGIDPRKIVVVSIMPCTSKKYEAKQEGLKVDGWYPVDYVLTTREMALWLKMRGIDLPQLEESEADDLGSYTGAAAIYGASGGVMESALRTAAYLIQGKDLEKLEFESVRGMEGIKKATVTIGELTLKVAVVTTAKNARKIIEELKMDPKAYDYVEFMACPGGCLGGGGQPKPTSRRIVKQRIESVYRLDSQKQLRLAHQNLQATDFLDYSKQRGEDRFHQLLHRGYNRKKRFE